MKKLALSLILVASTVACQKNNSSETASENGKRLLNGLKMEHNTKIQGVKKRANKADGICTFSLMEGVNPEGAPELNAIIDWSNDGGKDGVRDYQLNRPLLGKKLTYTEKNITGTGYFTETVYDFILDDAQEKIVRIEQSFSESGKLVFSQSCTLK